MKLAGRRLKHVHDHVRERLPGDPDVPWEEVNATTGAQAVMGSRANYSHIAMTEPTPTVLPDPPLEPRRPGEPPAVDIPEPPDPAEPWNEPELPEPPTPRPPELPPDDDP